MKAGAFLNNFDTKLKLAFEKGLGIPADTDFASLEFAKSEHWDSIAHMKLVAALEEEFAIQLDVNDILGLSSFQVAQEMLKKYADNPSR